MYKNIILPASLLAATIIGAGMFALPYVFAKAGIFSGVFYLLFFSLIIVLIHLMYADIIVRTPENHRLLGYAKIYFGRIGFWLAFLLSVVGAIFALTIYLILSVSFVNLVGGASWPDIYKLLGFWFLGSIIIFININKLTISEFSILILSTFIILALFFYGGADFGRLSAIPLINFNYFLFPYGAALFALSGGVVIPTVLGYFRNNGESVKKAKLPIILGSLIPAVIYFIFVAGVWKLSGEISEDAVSGLVNRLPFLFLAALGVLGAVSLWSTYIVIGRNIKKSFEHDLNFPHFYAGLIAIFSPLTLYFLGFKNFLGLVAFVGGLFISIEGILIILMWRKASKIPNENQFFQKINPFIIYGLLLVFGGGIIYTLIY
ncbi:MAG: aromatic amino acid transport family protein [Patescibacteria group bacterium]